MTDTAKGLLREIFDGDFAANAACAKEVGVGKVTITVTVEQADRITALLDSGGWLPIETAPKGAQILVTGGEFSWDAGSFDAEANCTHVAMVYWNEIHKHWAGDYTGNGEDRYIYRPTHWQPLPSLPKEKP